MKKGKYIIVSIVIVAIVILLCLCVKFFVDDNDIIEKSIKERYESVLEDCGDTLTFYDYEVTLEKSYYSEATGDACCMISIKKTTDEWISENVWVDTHKKAIYMRAVEDDLRTTITGMVSGRGHVDMEYENVNGIVNIYIAMNMLPNEDGVSIVFEDQMKKVSEPETIEYQRFVLRDTSDSVYISAGDISACVSENGIILNEDISLEQLCIIENDNTKHSIVLDRKCQDGYAYLADDMFLKYNFDNIIKTENIKIVEINGSDYYPKTGKLSNTYEECKNYTYENNGMRTSFVSEIDEKNETVKLTYTATWTSSPTERNIDWINFEWNDMSFKEGSECKVTHKVYEKNETSGNGEWIVNECSRTGEDVDLYGDFADYVGIETEIKADTYDIDVDGMCVFISLYNNKEEDKVPFTFTEETVIVELELELEDFNQTNRNFYASYYHNKTKCADDVSRIMTANVVLGAKNVIFKNSEDDETPIGETLIFTIKDE